MKPERDCGGCTACCWGHQVPSIKKPMRSTCPHQSFDGCRIYGSHPAECRSYYCVWKYNLGSDRFRPDRLGIIVSIVGVGSARRVQLVEIGEGALRSELGKKIVGHLSRRKIRYEFSQADGTGGLAVLRRMRDSPDSFDDRLGARRSTHVVLS